MVTNEAKRILAADSYRMTKIVEKGKIGPDQIGPYVLFRIGNRIVRANMDRTTITLVKRAIGTRAGSARTHSELFGFKISNLLTTTIGRLDPEEQRGILHYVAGDQTQHGLAVMALQLLGESSAVDVTQRLVGWKAEYLERLGRRDAQIRASVERLPIPIRRICHGSLHEASLCLSVGDERTAMGWLRQVRRLVDRYETAGGPP